MHLQCLPIKILRVRGLHRRPFTEHCLYCSYGSPLALQGSTKSFLVFYGSPCIPPVLRVVFSGQLFFMLSVSARLKKKRLNNLIWGAWEYLGT